MQRIRQLAIAVGTLILVTGPQLRADDANSTDFEKLVESLATSNPSPMISERRRVKLPVKFDWAEHERVVKAATQVTEHPVEAWESLIKHADDDRYCLTLDIDDSFYNWSVGTICTILLNDSIRGGYRSYLPLGKEASSKLHRPSYIPREPREFKAWCQKQQAEGRELVDIQIEAAEWALQQFPKLKRGISGRDSGVDRRTREAIKGSEGQQRTRPQG